jgi:hypothetical protein
MHTEILVFLVIIILIILIIALVYATRAAEGLAGYSDPNITIAHTYLAWTVAVLWLVIAGAIIGVIALFIFGPELIPTFGKSILYIALLAFFIGLIAAGVVASIAAYHINNSTIKSKVEAAYRDTIISAVTALGSTALIIIIAVVVWYY